MLGVFLAYSHQDEELRNELETHMALLKRQNIIGVWHDRRIGAGKDIDSTIHSEFDKCQIILLLVSSYFLNSDYCYDVEMTRAMERHKEGSARVIPVILRPCDWKPAPFGGLKALPKDGKPVTKYADQHEAFLEIAQGVRDVASERSDRGKSEVRLREGKKAKASTENTRARSSNLRVKKTFSDREKDRFLKDTFEYVANFFDGSLDELKARNKDIETDFTRIDARRFAAVVYRKGKAESRCTVTLNQGGRSLEGITILLGEHWTEGSYNEILTISDDGYSLFLRSSGMRSGTEQQLTLQGGAEFLWAFFMEPLQR